MGLLLLIMPETSLLWICYAFGVVVLVTGIVCLIQYARIRGTGFTAPFMLVGGVITAGLGLFTLAKPQVVASFLPVVFGIFIVVDGLQPHRLRPLTWPSARGEKVVVAAAVQHRVRCAGCVLLVLAPVRCGGQRGDALRHPADRRRCAES